MYVQTFRVDNKCWNNWIVKTYIANIVWIYEGPNSLSSFEKRVEDTNVKFVNRNLYFLTHNRKLYSSDKIMVPKNKSRRHSTTK